jgi:hypothetical protein
LAALTAFTNPTPYSANVPYLSIDFLSRNNRLGSVIVRNTSVQTGENEGVSVFGVYDPLHQENSKQGGEAGEKARDEGRALLGKFISGGGDGLVIGVRGSRRSFVPEGSPAANNDSCMAAALGRVLENFGTFEVKIPKGLFKIGAADEDDDGDDDDDGLHFIQDATFHLFSSTATFVLLNPLPHDSITITRLNATALYPRAVDDGDGDGDGDDDDDDGGDGRKKKPTRPPHHDPDDDDPWLAQSATATISSDSEQPKPPKMTLHPIARIFYDSPLTIPPRPKDPLPSPPSDGDDEDRPGWETPRLPVEWSLGSVGYEAVRKALGGSLKVGARAEIDVAVGRFREEGIVFEREGGIGAKVRL